MLLCFDYTVSSAMQTLSLKQRPSLSQALRREKLLVVLISLTMNRESFIEIRLNVEEVSPVRGDVTIGDRGV